MKKRNGRPYGAPAKVTGEHAGLPDVKVSVASAKLLGFVVGFVDDNGYPPTLREVCKAVGVRSTNGIREHLRALIHAGLLVRYPKIARGLVVTDAGRQLAHHWGLH